EQVGGILLGFKDERRRLVDRYCTGAVHGIRDSSGVERAGAEPKVVFCHDILFIFSISKWRRSWPIVLNKRPRPRRYYLRRQLILCQHTHEHFCYRPKMTITRPVQPDAVISARALSRAD